MNTQISLSTYLWHSNIKLPYRIIARADSLGYSIEVETPMGKVEINEIEYSQGFFVTRKEEKSPQEISNEIEDLEQESKSYLLNNWLKSNTN